MDIQPIYFDGQWRAADTFVEVTNKYTGEVMARVARSGALEVEQALEAARTASKQSALTLWERYQILNRTSSSILARRE